MEPEPEKPESVPPDTATSSTVKSEEGSDSSKVTTDVCKASSVNRLELIATVGGIVSTARERTCEASFKLPAASWKTPAATLIEAVALLLAAGVKVAA